MTGYESFRNRMVHSLIRPTGTFSRWEKETYNTFAAALLIGETQA